MKHLRVARRYASALMGLAQGQKSVDKISADLQKVREVLEPSREFRLLVASPVVSAAKKADVFRAVFGRLISREAMAFLEFLLEKQREAILLAVIAQFESLRDELLGIVTAEVTSVVEFTGPQEKKIQAELERYTKRKIRLRFALDKSITGGLVVKMGDTVIDASLRHQLEVLRKRFVESGPLSN